MQSTKEKKLLKFQQYLEQEEKSMATIEKYLRDVRTFYEFLEGRQICKKETIAYKEYLVGTYSPSSVNSMLVSLNSFLSFIRKSDCRIKLLKIQRQIFREESRELTRQDYLCLLNASRETRLSLVMQTICGTGIRVSELQYITVDAVQSGRAVVNCKNKTRVVFIPTSLQKILKDYIKKSGVETGSVFVTRTGAPLDRSNIWRDMKSLCRKAGISADKVFPHNLRHLFARTFYTVEKDIVCLADLLGHSSINTTRVYTIETGSRHISCLERIQKRLMT